MKRVARWSAYVAAGIVVLLVAAALILPAFLDSSGIEADLQRSLSHAVGGEIKWQKLQVRLLPTPHGELRRLQVALPGTSASAERVDASLALWPLLRGRAEIVSVRLLRPEVRIEFSPGTAEDDSEEDAGATYRRVMGEVVRALREFAPDTAVEIRNGQAEIHSPGGPAFVLRELWVRANSGPDGLKLQIDTTSDYWQRLHLAASVSPADLSATANVDVTGIRGAAGLPTASLRAKARTDAKTSVELTLEEAKRGGTAIGPGEARYTFKDGLLAANVVFDLDAAQAIVSAHAAAVPLGGVDSARGHVSGKAAASVRGGTWKAELQVLKSSLQVDGWNLPAPVGLAGGSMTIDANRMRFDRVGLSLAGSQAVVSATLAGYQTAKLAVDASATIDLDLAQGLKAAGAMATQAGIEAANGRVSARASAAGRGGDWTVSLDILKSDGSVQGWRLPGPLGLAGGSASLEGKRITFKGVTLTAGQGKATLSGSYDLSSDVVDAQIDSPGIVADALIPKPDPAKKPAPEKKSLWPLPVTGSVALRTDFIRFQRHNFAPVSAALTLQSDSARLEIKEMQLCGISLPLSIEARKEAWSASALITAQGQQIEASARCLSEERVQLTGDFDLHADLTSKGAPKELARNLQGTLEATARGGELARFALIGNIQKTIGLKAGEGFPYRTITAKGRFRDGKFFVREATLESPIMGLAANGWISLGDYESSLTVLVAPLAILDQAVRAVPLVGYVIGGAVTSIPVGVSGDIRDPRVVPLGPTAITSELTGIIRRTIKLPKHLEREEKKEEEKEKKEP